MSSASRVSFCLLALSLSLINSPVAQLQSSSRVPGSAPPPGESAVRVLVEKYFALYAAEDIDGVISLYSEKAPEYASLKQNLQRQFATDDFSVSDPVISRVKVEGEKASLRAATNLTAVNRKSSQKREQRVVRNFGFASEGGQWKIWRSAPAAEDLAEALVGAKTEAERDLLLTEEKDLVTPELVLALNGQGDRLYTQGSYSQALAIYNQTQRIAEQIGDRWGIAITLNDIGNIQRSQGMYAKALESYQKSLAIVESLGDKLRISTTLGLIGNVYV